MKHFFAMDDDGDFEFFDTAKEAADCAADALAACRDNSVDYGWCGDVENVMWGRILQRAVEVRREDAPEGSEFDEIIDYGLRPEINLEKATTDGR